jgi:hypothetical protein
MDFLTLVENLFVGRRWLADFGSDRDADGGHRRYRGGHYRSAGGYGRSR